MNAQSRIDPATLPANRFSVAEFAQMIPAFGMIDANVELDRGMLVRMNPAKFPHSKILITLQYALRDAYLAAGSALQVHPELSIFLAPDTIRVPDIAVIEDPGDEQGFVDARLVRHVVEVSNNSLAYDLGAKAQDYASAGIAEYWVVDIAARAVTLMRGPAGGDYARRDIVRFGEPLAVPGTRAAITLP